MLTKTGAGLAGLLLLAAGSVACLPSPAYDHIVIVVEENHTRGSILGNPQATYMNRLANGGASFSESYAETHPSLPNYLALFSGSTQGVTNDACPPAGAPYNSANLASDLGAVGKTFAGYSEDLPATGSTVCSAGGSGGYQRKHNPWSYFSNVSPNSNRPMSAFPANFDQLPTVAMVVPNQTHDMHDGTIAQADSWLQTNLGSYAEWAKTHNSLLIVTWDEDDSSGNNHIATMFYGAKIKPGVYNNTMNHYNLLRTVEDIYKTGTHAGQAANVAAIDSGCWA